MTTPEVNKIQTRLPATLNSLIAATIGSTADVVSEGGARVTAFSVDPVTGHGRWTKPLAR
jgi:hypothetical protein